VCGGPSAGLWAAAVRPDIRIARPVRQYRDPLVVPYEPDGQVLSYRVSACPDTAFRLAIHPMVMVQRSVKVDSNPLQSQWFTPAMEDWKSRVRPGWYCEHPAPAAHLPIRPKDAPVRGAADTAQYRP
jgi:hypothetical protein